MEKPPISDERIIEAIEACRPGRDDVSDAALVDLAAEMAANPALARHYERLQRVDANLVSAFKNVPVPDGLDQRLLARLQQARPESVEAEAVEAVEAEEGTPHQQDERVATEVAAVVRPERRSRRRVLWAGGVIAAVAILAVAATLYLYGAGSYTQANVLEHSVAFFQVESPKSGALVDRSSPPEAYPFSRSVGHVREMRWRPIGRFLGRDGVAYDLPIGDRATLYVVRRTVAGLASNPPLRPQKDTGGFSAATWQEGELLYVLVLRGNNSPAIYRNLVDLPHGPLL